MTPESRHLSRKFILALLSFGIGSVYIGVGLLSADQWIGLVQWTLGLYFAGNVGTTLAGQVVQR